MKKTLLECYAQEKTAPIPYLLKIMLALLLFSLSTLQLQADTIKDHTVTLVFENALLKDVLTEVESQSGYRFFYNHQTIDVSKKVTITLRNVPLEAAIKELFKGEKVIYKFKGDQIVLKRKRLDDTAALRIPTEQEIIQSLSLPEGNVSMNSSYLAFIITGKVTDEQGEGLPGVNILLKGTTTGTTTDGEGKYSLSVPDGNGTLVFSFIGYTPAEVAIANQSTINISLTPDVANLQEVVVVGYGEQKKVTVAGAISTITTKELRQSPTANLTNALAGRMPGLIVNQYAGGEPGVDRSDIFIRGIGTYNNARPIVIVDGVERSFDYLSPDEVETFTIMKDASATAVFGVRGANGVILVTTKRGKRQEKTEVNFRAQTGVTAPIKFPKYLGSADYAMLYNEAIQNDNPGRDPSTLNLFSPEQIENYRSAVGDNSDGKGYNIDLFDYAFKPSWQQDYSLTLQGGTTNVRYFVLANYFSQNGNYKHSDLQDYSTNAIFKRYNFRSNIDIDVTKNFYARLDLSARITNRNAPGTTATRLIQIANTTPPIYPVVLEQNDHPDNTRLHAMHPGGLLFGNQIYRFNMLGELSRSGFLIDYQTTMNGTFILGHKLDFITQGLKADAMIAYDSYAGHMIERWVPTEADGYRQYPGYAIFYPSEGLDVYRKGGHYQGAYTTPRRENDRSLNNGINKYDPNYRTYYQFTLNYARPFGRHNVTAMALANRSIRNIANQVAYAYQGLSGRATYNFDERYLLEVNFAYNGSENFAPGYRYGFFPAVSAGWVLSNEAFMNSSFINLLKIRGSYGIVGNDQLPGDPPRRFGYLQFYGGSGNYHFGTALDRQLDGISEGDLANPLLTWEKARKTNIGFETILFNNRFSATVDVFYEDRFDIITQAGGDSKGYSDVVGKAVPPLNIGRVENKGLDFQVSWQDQIGGFRYYISPNFTFARNKIRFMNEIDREYAWARRTGTRIGEHFVYVFDGFIRNQEEADQLNDAGVQPWGKLIPGDVKYKDLNGDGRITDQEDRMPIGNPRIPEIMFGVPVGFSYKNFDFSMLLQGATNTSVLLTGPSAWDFPLFDQDKLGKVKPIHLNRWTPETADRATYPALHYGEHNNNKNSNSSLFLYDGTYLRLKTIELGYNLPQSFINRVGLSTVRLYVQGLNLLTWDKLTELDMDPETREGSGDWYPIQKVYSFGLNVSF